MLLVKEGGSKIIRVNICDSVGITSDLISRNNQLTLAMRDRQIHKLTGFKDEHKARLIPQNEEIVVSGKIGEPLLPRVKHEVIFKVDSKKLFGVPLDEVQQTHLEGKKWAKDLMDAVTFYECDVDRLKNFHQALVAAGVGLNEAIAKFEGVPS
ncbi:hypothetical protein L1887_35719 [Cichorium endivia]|nr:hypothetical protein L1887_35719 [Cichorium endivia]